MKRFLNICILMVSVCVGAQEKVTVYFDLDSHEMQKEGSLKLSEWFSQNQQFEIQKVYGYCDSVGTYGYNDKLALRRIRTILDILKKNSVRFSKTLEIKGFGERFEQSPDQGENRKVEIYFNRPEAKRAEKEEKMAEKVAAMKVGDKLRLRHLNFYNRSGRVVPKSIPVLEELYQIMKDNPKLKIDIQGHICCQPQGDLEDISTLRSRTVYNYLIEKGIDKSRLTYQGYGSTMPLYPIPEKNEFERDENRRVEIMIVANQ
ncbi:OmpA family protein [Flavobacterium suncheonense]|uniref:OmpA-like domain-containing protein n=1 Tax=Flavobacterium suncheonense GH29-5 = DSM 17707 TaxID=1121899 RepID=A0A0A2M4Z4_9FLAO|nr:OmpA family protein [Flavobacterium suncheonense]KGO87692.1 hypothetical protein Q764_12555 [Flavobacterium suncheonense GH29-5 = DSM 17707]